MGLWVGAIDFTGIVGDPQNAVAVFEGALNRVRGKTVGVRRVLFLMAIGIGYWVEMDQPRRRNRGYENDLAPFVEI